MARSQSAAFLPAGASYTGVSGLTRTNLQGCGTFRYLPGATGRMFAGEFWIDTGFNDLSAYTAGTDPAEIYGARVYIANGAAAWPGAVPGANVIFGRWYLVPTATFTSDSVWSGSVPANTRIFIHVKAYYQPIFTSAQGHAVRLDSVNWSLYRI